MPRKPRLHKVECWRRLRDYTINAKNSEVVSVNSDFEESVLGTCSPSEGQLWRAVPEHFL